MVQFEEEKKKRAEENKETMIRIKTLKIIRLGFCFKLNYVVNFSHVITLFLCVFKQCFFFFLFFFFIIIIICVILLLSMLKKVLCLHIFMKMYGCIESHISQIKHNNESKSTEAKKKQQQN